MREESGNKAYGSLPKGGTLLLQRGEDKVLRVIKGRTYNVRIQRVGVPIAITTAGISVDANSPFDIQVLPNVVAFRVQNLSTTADMRVAAGETASSSVGWLIARRAGTGAFNDTGWIPLTGTDPRLISVWQLGPGTAVANVAFKTAGEPGGGVLADDVIPVTDDCCPLVRVFFSSGGSEATPEDFELQPGQDLEFTADNDTVHFIQFESLPEQTVSVWVREAVGHNG